VLAKQAHEIEHPCEFHAGFQCAQIGGLYRGPVGHRIAEGHTELDDIGAGLRQAFKNFCANVKIRIAGGDESDEAALLFGFERSARRARPFLCRRIPLALFTLHPQPLRHRENILIPAAAHIHYQQVIFRQFRCDFHDMGQGVRRLERWNDAFQLAAKLKGLDRFFIGRRDV
jgi:hypothetical protein